MVEAPRGTVAYEAPALVEIGAFQELTLGNKDFGGVDGITFQSQPVAWTSA